MRSRQAAVGWMFLFGACDTSPPPDPAPGAMPEFGAIAFREQEVAGIGLEPGVCRRDPSDVIRVDGTDYVYYTRILGRASGYWGTVWVATSTDGGHTWIEGGEVLGPGASGTFDSHAVFTPNILAHGGRYWLYYTGVRPTPGSADGTFENNSENDFTAIGVAVANAPGGPFHRVTADPVLVVSSDPAAFDSYRVDDAALLVRADRIWLYYKGRSLAHGPGGPRHTRMGLAIADRPAGPFVRQTGGRPILAASHEVLVWPHRRGVAALASISSTVEFAPDGVDFTSSRLAAPAAHRPQAPGAFRPDLTEPVAYGGGLRWGIAMRNPGGNPYLVRYEVDLAPTAEND